MEYLIAHTSWLDEMLGLCDSERGRLFTALLQYAASGEMQEPRGSERILYHKLIKCIDQDIKRDIYKYNKYIYHNESNLNTNNASNASNTQRVSNLNSYQYQIELFDKFWEAYPVHTNVKDCMLLWRKIRPDAKLLQRILDAIERQKKSRQWQNGYIPDPDRWLSKEKWNDDVRPDVGKARKSAGYADRPLPAEYLDSITVDLDKLYEQEFEQEDER